MFRSWTDQAILEDLGSRIRQHRLNRNISQGAVAERAGVSVATVRNLESGNGSSVTTLIRLLRGLGMLHRLEMLIPETEPSPLQLLRLKGEGRVRASGSGELTVPSHER